MGTDGVRVSTVGRRTRDYDRPIRGGTRALTGQWKQAMAKEVTTATDTVCGDVDEGYGRVADAFRRNLSSGQEIGAAVAVYRDGRKVVDLWGGFRNGHTRAPWQKDTIVNVFSTTKGVASLAVAVAASRGLIDYDAKVADYWPEFAQAGKGADHRAPATRPPGRCSSAINTAAYACRYRRPARSFRRGSRRKLPPVAARHQARLPRCHSRLV